MMIPSITWKPPTHLFVLADTGKRRLGDEREHSCDHVEPDEVAIDAVSVMASRQEVATAARRPPKMSCNAVCAASSPHRPWTPGPGGVEDEHR